MKDLFDFAKLFVFSPDLAARACDKPRAWMHGLRIGAFLALFQVFVSYLNPLAFMDPTAPVAPSHSLWFWVTVALFQPLLMAVSVYFTVLLSEWMRTGWLPAKTAAATLWCAVLVAMALGYSRSGFVLSKGTFEILLILWLLPTFAYSRRIPAAHWLRVATFLLGLSVIQILCLCVELAFVASTRSVEAFYAVSLLTLLWMVAFFGSGMRAMTGASSARSILAFVFAMVVATVFPLLAYLLGLLPKEVLKVILFV